MTVFGIKDIRLVSKISVRRALAGHAAAARPSFPAGDPADLASLRNVCSAARRESMSAISADASAEIADIDSRLAALQTFLREAKSAGSPAGKEGRAAAA